MEPQQEKIALFIDGANLYATAKALGFDIDYKRLLREFQSRGYLMRAFYYTAVIEDQEYSSIRPLIDWLDYNGYSVVTKATKEFVDQTGRRKVKGNMDIELAVDAMEIAEHIDQMVLFSGDGDFRSLVEAMQRRGVRVTVVSTISTQPPMVADELRRQADVFLDIVELQPKIGRDPAERAAREAREPRERHTPQFLQRSAAPQRAGAGALPTTMTTSTIDPLPMTGESGKPGRNCPRCPRLKAFRDDWRRREPTWFNAPVPSFGPAHRAAADRRPGARPARGQPHRPPVHRRLCRRAALRHAGALRLRPRQVRRRIPTTGSSSSMPASPMRCAACRRRTSRPAAEIATCRAFLKRHHRRDAQAARDRGARPHRA